jgi:hypothetical protein
MKHRNPYRQQTARERIVEIYLGLCAQAGYSNEQWVVSMWKAGHMPKEIRNIWVQDYIPGDQRDEPAPPWS